MIAYADFFTGIAGCVIAAELVGFTPVVFCEIEDFPRRLLKYYWPGVPILNDIRTVTVDDVRGVGRIDIAHFSPPCQSLSIAGKQEAEADLRYLWPDTARVISLLRPTWVVVENVNNAVNLVLDDWLSDLDGIGYETAPIVLPAAAVGAPHIRSRLYLVAHAKRDESERGRSPRSLGFEEGEDQSREEKWERVRDAARHSGALVESATSARRASRTRASSGAVRDDSGSQESERRSCAGESVVADSNGVSLEGDRPEGVKIPGEPTEASTSRCLSCGDGSTNVGNATLLGHERSWESWDGRNGSEDSDPFLRTGKQTESELGGNADVLPNRLDGYTLRGLTWSGWPAGMGPTQYDDEPPRTGGDLANRRARIKAIGNAVPPAQVYPIFKAIADEIRSCQS